MQEEVPVKLDTNSVLDQRRLDKAEVIRIPTSADQEDGSQRGEWANCQICVKRTVHGGKEEPKENDGDQSPKGSETGSLQGTDAPEGATGGMTMTYPHIKAGDGVCRAGVRARTPDSWG